MIVIPRTYKFKHCDISEFISVLKSKNAELIDIVLDKEDNRYIHSEISKGDKYIIYKNNQIIGYLGITGLDKMLANAEKQYKNFNNRHNISKTDETNNPFIGLAKYIKFIKQFIKPSHNALYVGAVEIFKEFRSINTIKVVFNFIKQYCLEHNYDFALCNAKDQKIARLYQQAGFKSFFQNDVKNPLLYMYIDKHDYYKVTEKLNINYMRNNKLYEKIMTNISKQVKKLIRENEYWDEPYRDLDDEDEDISYKISQDELPVLSNSEINKFKLASKKLLEIANDSDADNFDECVRIVSEQVDDVLFDVFGKIPSSKQVLSYLADKRGKGIDWSSLEDLGYTDPEDIDEVYYELAHRAVEDTYKY